MPPRKSSSAATRAASPRGRAAGAASTSPAAAKRAASPAAPKTKAAQAKAAAAAAAAAASTRRLSPSPSPSRSSGRHALASPPRRPLHHLSSDVPLEEDEDAAHTDDEEGAHLLLEQDSTAHQLAAAKGKRQHVARSPTHEEEAGSEEDEEEEETHNTFSRTTRSQSKPTRSGSAALRSRPAASLSPREASPAPRAAPSYHSRPSPPAPAVRTAQSNNVRTTSSATTAKTVSTRGFCSRLVRALIWTTLLFTLLLGALVGYLFYEASQAADSPSPHPVRVGGLDDIAQLAANLANRHAQLSEPIRRVMEPAMRHHAESFATAHAAAGISSHDGGADAASAEWLSGGIGVMQPTKPLVLVLAIDGPSSRQQSRALLDALVTLLWTSPDTAAAAAPTTPLLLESHLLDLGHEAHQSGKKKLTNRFVRGQLKAFFAQSEPGFLAAHVAQIKQVLSELLPAELQSALVRSSVPVAGSMDALRSSLERGFVFVPTSGSASLPRAAAEAFHHYADDVQAPVKRAAFVFEVDVRDARARAEAEGQGRMSAEEAVRRTLEDSWAVQARTGAAAPSAEQAEVARDEVLRPLLSRIVRNVVDLTRA